MSNLQWSEWSTEKSPSTVPQPASTNTKASGGQNTVQSSKTARQPSLPWLVAIKGLILGSLIGGIALAVVLTLWLRSSSTTTTLLTTVGITAMTDTKTTISTATSTSSTSSTTGTSTTSTSTTSVTTSTTTTSVTSTTSTTSVTSSTSTTSVSTSTTTRTSTTSVTTSTTTTSVTSTTSTTSVTSSTSSTSVSTSTTTSTSTSTTTRFSTGWNASGITVAGVTGSTGVGLNQFYHPFCIVLGSSNTMYVTDQQNQRLQRWLTNATTSTTVAGASNAATGASLIYLSYPSDLAVDSNDNLYVVDGGNHRVVFWARNATTGVLVAGTGSSGSANNELSSPIGLARDSSTGTLYISDAGNHRVMRYLSGASSGTLIAGGNGAGTGNTQLNNPRGLHYDSSTNSLLIANNNAHNVVRWVIGASSWTLITGSISGVTGTTSIMLAYPTDVTLDWMGNMYVSDEGNQRIQFYLAGQSNGSTIAGVTGTSGSSAQLFSTPSSVAVDSQFHIYVTDYNNHRVQKFLHY